jgi:hypothetical protein
MAYYQIFLRILSQFSQKNCATIDIDERKLKISVKDNKWVLSTLLFQGEAIPLEFKSFSHLRWQARGAYLQFNDEGVYLLQQIDVPQYLTFKPVLADFLEVAVEWQSLFYDMSEKEYVC